MVEMLSTMLILWFAGYIIPSCRCVYQAQYYVSRGKKSKLLHLTRV